MSVKCITEWASLIFMVILIVISHLNIIGPFRRGFFCDDETIRYPYKSTQLVSPYLLLLLSFVLPIVIVFVIENRKRVWRFWKCHFWTNFGNVTSTFVFGFIITYFLTQTCKLSVGRLRPHFIDVCHPSFNYTTESGSLETFTLTLNNYNECPHTQYISNYFCTTGLSTKIRQGRYSFFSGHSSLIAYGLIFLNLVLKNSKLTQRHRIPMTCLQSMFIAIVLFTGSSRVSDYWHHWQDVTVGLLVGTVLAMVIYTYVHKEKMRNISRDSQRSNELPEGRKLSSII